MSTTKSKTPFLTGIGHVHDVDLNNTLPQTMEVDHPQAMVLFGFHGPKPEAMPST